MSKRKRVIYIYISDAYKYTPKKIYLIVQCSTIHTGDLVSVPALHIKADVICFCCPSRKKEVERQRQTVKGLQISVLKE